MRSCEVFEQITFRNTVCSSERAGGWWDRVSGQHRLYIAMNPRLERLAKDVKGLLIVKFVRPEDMVTQTVTGQMPPLAAW